MSKMFLQARSTLLKSIGSCRYMSALCHAEFQDGVKRITFTAPKTRNALSLEMINQLNSEILKDKVSKQWCFNPRHFYGNFLSEQSSIEMYCFKSRGSCIFCWPQFERNDLQRRKGIPWGNIQKMQLTHVHHCQKSCTNHCSSWWNCSCCWMPIGFYLWYCHCHVNL